jgi:hypothetical protein
MYQSIKRVVKPETFGGLNRIPAPCHRQALKPAPSIQALLATVADEDIVRDSLLDIETIESVTCIPVSKWQNTPQTNLQQSISGSGRPLVRIGSLRMAWQ